MTATIDKMLGAIIDREGGYVNNPADKGGPTKFGITLKTLDAWRHRTCNVLDIQELSEAEALEIYRSEYVNKPGFANLSDVSLQELIIDTGINHGPKEAIQLLQRTLGVSEDGILGLQTLKALGSVSPVYVWFKYMGYRLGEYASIVYHDDTQFEFAQGWLNRCINILSAHSAEVVLREGAKTMESNTALGLAATFDFWSKQLHPLAKAKQLSFDIFTRARGDCLQAAAKFK